MDEELKRRIRRIYAAVGATEETDLTQFKPVVLQSDSVVVMYQDWSGGKEEEEIENDAHLVIHNIGNLFDHLRRAAAKLGFNKDDVNVAAEGSAAIQLVRDLSNNDKHGYPPRDGGFSKSSPRVQNIRRVMRMSSGAQPDGFAAVTLGPGGPQFSGTGSATVIITGEIVDPNGKPISDLDEVIPDAIAAWEQFLDRVVSNWRS